MKKGFTLIELMIVIAIVGILAAIAIPNFTNMRDQASISAAFASLQNVRKAIEAYKSIGDGSIPSDYASLQNALDTEDLFSFDQLEADMQKFAYGATSDKYTLAGLAFDSDNTCVWVDDKNSQKGEVKDCESQPAPETGLANWDIEF